MSNVERFDLTIRYFAPVTLDMSAATILSIDSVEVRKLDAAKELIEIRNKLSDLVCNQQVDGWSSQCHEAIKKAVELIGAVRELLNDESLYAKYMHQYDALSAAQRSLSQI